MELHDISKKVDNLTSEVKEIKDAILGNAFTKGKGMIEIQQDHTDRIQALEAVRNVDHETRLSKLEVKFTKAQIWGYSLCIIFGAVVGVNIAKYLTNLATHFFTK